MMTAVCRVPGPKEGKDKSEVIIANFEHGCLAAENEVRFALLSQSGNVPQHRRKRKLVAETDRLTYVGNSFGESASKAAQHSDFMLGVYDEVTKQMKLYPASIFNLLPKFNLESDGEDEVDANKTLSFAQKSDRLTSAFGSSKRKRAMESRLRNKIEGEALDHALGSAVDQVLAQADVDSTITPVKKAPEASSVIPPFNKDAARPEEVYSLADIIPPECMQALKTPLQDFINGDHSSYPSYIQNQLIHLPLVGKGRSHRAGCLLYLKYMITMYGLKAADLRRKDPFPEKIPDIVLKNLLNRFTVVTEIGSKPLRCMPIRSKDMLLSYMLVLCLLLDEFNFEYETLQKDLKHGERNMVLHLKAIGCKINTRRVQDNIGSGKTDIKYATLPVPLTFPEIKTRRKSGKT